MLGSPILYLKAMRILMFQLSGFYCMIIGLKRVLFTIILRGFKTLNPFKLLQSQPNRAVATETTRRQPGALATEALPIVVILFLSAMNTKLALLL